MLGVEVGVVAGEVDGKVMGEVREVERCEEGEALGVVGECGDWGESIRGSLFCDRRSLTG